PLGEDSILWKIMQVSYGILNKTHPNLTEECWLFYNIRPPFYEAIGSDAGIRRRNGTNPRECLWKQGKKETPGITLTQVTGKGKCVG
ncbi:ENV2 protein, partial [Sylvia borin]|nr:ENV2 protein [Sylvia borin]